MGSFYKAGKSYRYKFVDHLAKQRKLNFGTQKVCKRDQGYIDTHVTHLVSCRMNSTLIDPKVQGWLTEIKGSKVANKLAEWGLITDAGVSTLGTFLEWYFEQKTNVWKDVDGKPEWSQSSMRTNTPPKNYLLQYFGEDRGLHTITRGDADDFERWIRSDATRSNRKASVSKHMKVTKNWFSYIYRKQWSKENPFDHIICSNQVDRERIQYMSTSEAQKVLEHLTCIQHRLFFAMARFGGLRMPSEASNMKWSHIDFDANTLKILPVKTNGKERTMPLWPEIHQLAWDEFKSWQDSDRTDDYVFYRHRKLNRDGESKVSTKIVHHIKAAYASVGLGWFHKPMQNLRTSCENDLRQFLPEGQLTEFMGHTSKVAQLHYRKTTPEEYVPKAGKDQPKYRACSRSRTKSDPMTDCQSSFGPNSGPNTVRNGVK